MLSGAQREAAWAYEAPFSRTLPRLSLLVRQILFISSYWNVTGSCPLRHLYFAVVAHVSRAPFLSLPYFSSGWPKYAWNVWPALKVGFIFSLSHTGLTGFPPWEYLIFPFSFFSSFDYRTKICFQNHIVNNRSQTIIFCKYAKPEVFKGLPLSLTKLILWIIIFQT